MGEAFHGVRDGDGGSGAERGKRGEEASVAAIVTITWGVGEVKLTLMRKACEFRVQVVDRTIQKNV